MGEGFLCGDGEHCVDDGGWYFSQWVLKMTRWR